MKSHIMRVAVKLMPPMKSPKVKTANTLKRFKPIRRVSKAREKQQAEYAKVKKKFLASHSYCEVCSEFVSAEDRELHHWAGRVGRLLSWEPGFRMLCHSCHNDVHQFPAVASWNEYICPRGMWNDFARAQKHHEQTISTVSQDSLT